MCKNEEHSTLQSQIMVINWLELLYIPIYIYTTCEGKKYSSLLKGHNNNINSIKSLFITVTGNMWRCISNLISNVACTAVYMKTLYGAFLLISLYYANIFFMPPPLVFTENSLCKNAWSGYVCRDMYFHAKCHECWFSLTGEKTDQPQINKLLLW